MKVVLINHGTASEWGGGDSVQIKETAKRLIQRGHEVSVQNSDRPNVRGADIAHIFNSRVYNSFVQQIATCQSEGVPTIVSPIWISIGRAMWGSRATFGILSRAVAEGENSVKHDLDKLKKRKLIVKMKEGSLNSDGKGSYDMKWQEGLGELLNTVDGILTNSWLELNALQSDLNWKGDTFEVANYGVDPAKFLDGDPEPFREYTGINGQFVMQAGRIEAGKNQAMLCWALRNTDIPIVLIGGSKHWPAYSELCKKISGNKLTIIDHLPSKMLASAYAAAKVHCLVSWMDTCGLVSLEAGLNGTPIVGSTFGHELEYLKNDAWLADPGDAESIRHAVERAWSTGKNNLRCQNMKERILSDYNWEKTTSKTEKIYRKVIETA